MIRFGSLSAGSSRRFLSGLVVASVCSAGLTLSPLPSSANNGIPSTVAPKLGAQTVAYDGKLVDGWIDLGWGPRTLNKGPAKVDVGDWQGWILGRPGVDLSVFETLTLNVKLPGTEKPPLVSVRATFEGDDKFPSFRLGPSKPNAEGFYSYVIPASSLNPAGKKFDRLMFQGSRQLPPNTFVEIDKIVLKGRRSSAGSAPSATQAAPKQRASRPASISVDCAANRRIISPAIYGIAFNALTEESQKSQFTIGATSRRWGGDPTSRFNWEDGNAWNPGHNWYWRNLSVLNKGNAWQTYFTNNAKAKMGSALTIPMLGWVAKDRTSYSFPVSKVGRQQQTAPDQPDAGNGVASDGEKLVGPDPKQTSIASTPAMAAAWVKAIRSGGFSANAPLDMYFLDNEPDLWDSSHRDIRSTPSTYDELLEKGITYATALRAADPTTPIAGPSSWGWPGYFYSAADAAAGFSAKPDRRAHGDVPFLEWYLGEMAKAEKRSGKKLLDILDVHYYPAANGVFTNSGGLTDQATNEARVRSTRTLWDKTYKDDSWVSAQVYLLPRLQEMIEANKPGTGISIGEYNFGGETHMSGAIAQAEALGRFGQAGITAAYLWTHPRQDTEQYWGFRAFRNYDKQGANFGQYSVKAGISGANTQDLSVFASSDAFTKQKTLVFVNRSSTVPFNASLSFANCGGAASVKQWKYTGGPNGFETQTPGSVLTVAPWTITIVRAE
jgi:Glycoside hydrolase family 44